MKHIKSLLVVSLLLTSITSCSKREWKSDRPNILFLMLDTLRADHLSGYGYERQTSPVLDEFAKQNLKAAFALSAAPWTPASVASMLTGMYPSSHGMMPPNDRILAKKGFARLSDNLETLPEVLQRLGYTTAGVSPNPWITQQFGYTQGFEQFFFIDREPANKIAESGREIIEAWNKKGNTKPFFLYLHFIDPHDPYAPPAGYDTKFSGGLLQSPFTYTADMQQKINLYDGEISFLDSELGKFFNWLKDKKLYDDLMIVIVSDHGEQFMEHGDERHGYKLYNEEVHIPLMLKTGRAKDSGRVITETVSTVDIFPTILERLGNKAPSTLPGISLLNDEAIQSRRGILSEIRRVYDMKAVTDRPGSRLMMDVPYDQKDPEPAKSLQAWVTPRVIGVFDSQREYACMKPVQNKALEARLKGTFDELHTSALRTLVAPSGRAEEIKDETLEQLKSLGYLQ